MAAKKHNFVATDGLTISWLAGCQSPLTNRTMGPANPEPLPKNYNDLSILLLNSVKKFWITYYKEISIFCDFTKWQWHKNIDLTGKWRHFYSTMDLDNNYENEAITWSITKM